MSGIGEMFKKVPLPIWIGLGLVLLLILLMNRGGSSSQSQQVAGGNVTAPAGPVTNATVGTQGSQGGAGTDQELGNLSVITQSGFSQIAQQNQQTASELQAIMANGGVGTPMQQVGGAVQASQNSSAQNNAANGTAGQNAGSNPSTMSTSTG